MTAEIELNYSLTLDDFLKFNLYKASISKSINKRRKRNRFIFPLLYMIYGSYLSYSDKTWLGLIIFGGFSILWIFFYPKYESWRYKNHFSNHVKENNQSSAGISSNVKFTNSYIRIESEQSNSELNYSEFNQLVELENLFFLILKNGTGLIIKKEVVPTDVDLVNFISSKSIPYIKKIDWEWK